jgi:hypothetical protein
MGIIMRTQDKLPPVLDTAFWLAAVVVAVTTAFAILIMGIFATDPGTPEVMIVGLSVIIAGPIGLLLMTLTRLVCRAVLAGDAYESRTAMFVSKVVYCLGAPVLLIGTWHCVQLWTQAPVYQEAAVESHVSSIPAF